MDVEIAPTKKVTVLGLDSRSVGNIVWCAATYGMSRLYWADGYLVCLEVYEKSFEHEIQNKEFPVSQICYARFPKYEKLYEVDKTLQFPVVNASDMELFRSLVKAILEREKRDAKDPSC